MFGVRPPSQSNMPIKGNVLKTSFQHLELNYGQYLPNIGTRPLWSTIFMTLDFKFRHHPSILSPKSVFMDKAEILLLPNAQTLKASK